MLLELDRFPPGTDTQCYDYLNHYNPCRGSQSMSVVPGSATSSGRLAFADGLRALAAFWVVLHHLSSGHHIDTLRSHLPAWLNEIAFDQGKLGVPIFFVLSGFVMAHTVRHQKVCAGAAGQFLARRIVRLTPPYYFGILFAVGFIVLKKVALHDSTPLPSISTIVAHAFYMQDLLQVPRINEVFWTLAIELQFYLAFVAFVWCADALSRSSVSESTRLVVLTVVAASALPWAFGWWTTSVWPGGFLPTWYAFVAGVWVGWALAYQRAFKVLAAAFGLILCVAFSITHEPFTLTAGLTTLSLLVAGITHRMHTWLAWRWLQNLGLISYSLYLLHNPLTGAMANIGRRAVGIGLVPDLIVATVTIVACLVTAWVAYLWIEHPSIRWSHRFRMQRSQ